MANLTTAATFDEVRRNSDSERFVRKFRDTVLFLAPYDATPITNLTDASGELIAQIPEEYWPVGLVAKEEGIEVSRELEVDETEALGYGQAVRTDSEKLTSTMTFSPFEVMRRELWALTRGIPIRDLPQMQANGEVVIYDPTLPEIEAYKGFRISRDRKNGLWYYGTFFTRLEARNFPNESFKSTAFVNPLELAVSTDTELGYPTANFLAGPAMLENAAKLGWSVGSTNPAARVIAVP